MTGCSLCLAACTKEAAAAEAVGGGGGWQRRRCSSACLQRVLGGMLQLSMSSADRQTAMARSMLLRRSPSTSLRDAGSTMTSRIVGQREMNWAASDCQPIPPLPSQRLPQRRRAFGLNLSAHPSRHLTSPEHPSRHLSCGAGMRSMNLSPLPEGILPGDKPLRKAATGGGKDVSCSADQLHARGAEASWKQY